jgi:drug/metabolite transporter (DMT)-like permease
LLGILSLLSAMILVAGDQWLPRDRYWLSALAVTAVAGIAAYLLLRRGLRVLSPRAIAPAETLATLAEDRDWARAEIASLREPMHR